MLCTRSSFPFPISGPAATKRALMVFGIGPAGTGKTYLAVAMAISALLAKRVNRIILARPAVEAGERLGFLPGTLQDKIDPYLRPLYDALYDMELRKIPARPSSVSSPAMNNAAF